MKYWYVVSTNMVKIVGSIHETISDFPLKAFVDMFAAKGEVITNWKEISKKDFYKTKKGGVI